MLVKCTEENKARKKDAGARRRGRGAMFKQVEARKTMGVLQWPRRGVAMIQSTLVAAEMVKHGQILKEETTGFAQDCIWGVSKRRGSSLSTRHEAWAAARIALRRADLHRETVRERLGFIWRHVKLELYVKHLNRERGWVGGCKSRVQGRILDRKHKFGSHWHINGF